MEKDAPEIKQIAKTLLGKTEEETVRNTIAFVGKTLRKGPFDGADHGAVWALQNKEGDCTEFADLFLALCRANSVPARYRNGYLIHDVPKEDTPKHDWAEVYIAKYGWVPFDPLHTTQRGIATVNTLRPVYVYLDNQRTNAVFGKYHYFGFTCQGEKVRIQDEFKLKSRKAFAPK